VRVFGKIPHTRPRSTGTLVVLVSYVAEAGEFTRDTAYITSRIARDGVTAIRSSRAGTD
jgi:hypothetical protein